MNRHEPGLPKSAGQDARKRVPVLALWAVCVAGGLGILEIVTAIALWPGKGPAGMQEETSALWREFVRNPYRHPVLPNCAWAGYRCGESDLPSPAAVADVRECGAKGDERTDDTAAFRKAILRAKSAGGGAVLVPPGRYLLSDVLRLDVSGVVLRGESPEQSVLCFTKSLSDLRGSHMSWSWRGGLVWVQPPPSAESPAPEAHVTAAASIGERAIRIGSSEGQGGFRPVPGQAVVLTWVGGESLAVHLFGHPSGSEFPWEKWDWLWDGNLQWEWYNEVEKVEGAEVTLKKPLRLDIGSGWVVKLRPWTKCVEEVGIENLTIHVPVHRRPGHLRDPGYNGIFLENARNCWVRNVVIENGDNGVILENASNNTITSLRTTGAPCHHATSWRAFSHDNLMTNFRIENQPHHGIGSQDMASGNVWSDGVMEHGTLDLHCGMPFDSIRTNIAIVSCDGGGGGGGDAGPVCGRRIATWNVRVKSAGKQAGVALGSPEQYPLGAIVGLQGLSVPGNTKLWHMIAGDKGTVTVQEAAPPDLYLAQRKLRLSP